jgi:hypothetical protein
MSEEKARLNGFALLEPKGKQIKEVVVEEEARVGAA